MTLKEEFIKLGYTEEDYEIIRNNYAVNQIKDETLIKKLKDNFAFLLKIGYTKEEVIKMTKSFPPIYGLSIENIKQKIEDIISLGYTKEEVIKITKSSPQIYSLSIESIKQKIEDIAINLWFFNRKYETKNRGYNFIRLYQRRSN